jgi:hypothetical protein
MRGCKTLLAVTAFTIGVPAAENAAENAPLQLVGSAQLLGDRLRLTPAVRQAVGAAWYTQKQRVAGG